MRHYHESADCFEYPLQKSLLLKSQIKPQKKKPGIENFKLKKKKNPSIILVT